MWIARVKDQFNKSICGDGATGEFDVTSSYMKNTDDEGYSITFLVPQAVGLFFSFDRFVTIFHQPSVMLDAAMGQILVNGTVNDLPINAFIKLKP
jgi:hypothetical protein